jgi:hypothetical protein
MIIIDDSYKLLDEQLKGRKPKLSLEKNGQKFIFKYGAINYEIWSELIAEEIGKQIGIEMAHYEVAVCNGIYGVITPNFLGKNELIISSNNLKQIINSMFDENNIKEYLAGNSIDYIVNSAYVFDKKIDVQEMTNELLLRWAFIMLIMESDKNETNISFIKGNKGIRLSPDYDNSSMARLNENINNLLDEMKKGDFDIHKFTDEIKNTFGLTDESTGLFWNDFTIFARDCPEICASCLEKFENIDIDKAIENVEKNNDVTVPWEVKYWLPKMINTRFQDMKAISRNVNNKKIK